VLTFHESDRKLFRDTEVTSVAAVPERIVRVTKVFTTCSHGMAGN